MKTQSEENQFFINEIEKLEVLIKLHLEIDTDDFMVSQYKARKAELVKELV